MCVCVFMFVCDCVFILYVCVHAHVCVYFLCVVSLLPYHLTKGIVHRIHLRSGTVRLEMQKTALNKCQEH